MKTAFRTVLVAGLLTTVVTGCNKTPGTPTSQEQPAVVSDSAVSSGMWGVEQDTNKVTGDVKTYFTLPSVDSNAKLIVRRESGRLRAFVTTGDFLETESNVETRASGVMYKFDSDKAITQTWVLSDSNTALFYDGNVVTFINMIKIHKMLYFQYRPSGLTEKVVTFDLQGFPTDLDEYLHTVAYKQPKAAGVRAVNAPEPDEDVSNFKCPSTVGGSFIPSVYGDQFCDASGKCISPKATRYCSTKN